MIDGNVKRNHKFGFKLQSLHVIEKRYKMSYSSTERCTNVTFFGFPSIPLPRDLGACSSENFENLTIHRTAGRPPG